MAGRIQVLAVHVLCADVEAKRAAKTGRPSSLSPALEVGKATFEMGIDWSSGARMILHCYACTLAVASPLPFLSL